MEPSIACLMLSGRRLTFLFCLLLSHQKAADSFGLSSGLLRYTIIELECLSKIGRKEVGCTCHVHKYDGGKFTERII
nr:uncharacterized protein CTRU02_10342 [Colletotrichum truncatum]KAF6787546.1 hypothetical protein CTRU02_10342 [Colletotrichum truncatum]